MNKKYLHQKQLICLVALSPTATLETNHSPLTIHHSHKHKSAFTLAETLITLGIIGIVAALTIPQLIANYEKNVIVTRMQKFYTNFNEALRLSINENGDMSTWTFPQDYYDWQGSTVFFNTYLKQNLKYLKTESNVYTLWPTYGEKVYLSDGSAFVLSGTWVTYYPVASKTVRPGVDVFVFYIKPSENILLPHGIERNISSSTINTKDHTDYSCNAETRKDRIRSCSAYIMKAGWEIPDYYPFKELKRIK